MDIQMLDVYSAVAFVIILGAITYLYRERINFQKIAFPLLYLIMFRTKWGLELMDRLGKKHRELIKLVGYCFIGFAFLGMLLISLSILQLLRLLIFEPAAEETAVSLVLPFTNIAGIGFLSFWHWLISIFILAAVHEFAHGLMSRAHDVPVKSSGFAVFGVLLPILPAAFVEPDENVLKKKSDIVQYSVFSAGPMINIILAIIMINLMPYVGFGLMQFTQPLAPFEESFTEPVGFSYTLMNESLPAAKSGMPKKGNITALNGEAVEEFNDFAVRMFRVAPGERITITVNGEEYALDTVRNPDDESRAFIGILRNQNERVLKPSVSMFEAGIFYWFKGLFRWVFLLNLFVGLFNLLPVGIVDGGRMLQIALTRIIRDKKKAQRIWGTIGIIFLAILVFALLANYLGNPFSLLR